MITTSEALKIVRDLKFEKQVVEKELIHALDYILAEEILAPINFPPFTQSAMDGYVIAEFSESQVYHVLGEIKAGDSADGIVILPDQTYRIFTGAMVPENALAVIRQEDVERNENNIKIVVTVSSGANIRLQGEQTQVGQTLARVNDKVTATMIGFLAMFGITKVKVYKKPTIFILATGNELLNPKDFLTPGKIYESNIVTLTATLKQRNFACDSKVVQDDFDAIYEAAIEAIKNYDLVLFTGGISVGDYDFVKDVLQKLGVEEKFYKVRQKPGKPLFYGAKGNTIIYALPGNPASVLTCFFVYIAETLGIMTGDESHALRRNFVNLETAYNKSINLTCYLKGKLNLGSVQILPDQSSAMLSSFVHADCLVVLPEGRERFEVGEVVEVVKITS